MVDSRVLVKSSTMSLRVLIFPIFLAVLAMSSPGVTGVQQLHVPYADTTLTHTEGGGPTLHCLLLERKTFCRGSQETFHPFPGQDWVICPPSGCKNGWDARVSHLQPFCWEVGFASREGNACRKAANHICLIPPSPPSPFPRPQLSGSQGT